MSEARQVSLLLLPGLDGTGLLFQALLAALPSHIKPIVLAYPGNKQLSYAELLPRVLEVMPRSEPFIILGESFSGPLAIMVADRQPQNLLGVVLCASFVTPPWRFIGPAIRVLAWLPLFRLYLPYKRIKARLFGYSTPEHRAVLAEMQQMVRPHVIAHRVRMVFKVDVREILRTVQVPLLYLKGMKDFVVPAWNLRLIQQINPRVQVVEFPSSHMVLQSDPVQAAMAIAGFIPIDLNRGDCT